MFNAPYPVTLTRSQRLRTAHPDPSARIDPHSGSQRLTAARDLDLDQCAKGARDQGANRVKGAARDSAPPTNLPTKNNLTLAKPAYKSHYVKLGT